METDVLTFAMRSATNLVEARVVIRGRPDAAQRRASSGLASASAWGPVLLPFPTRCLPMLLEPSRRQIRAVQAVRRRSWLSMPDCRLWRIPR